jgi:hypothetical protein
LYPGIYSGGPGLRIGIVGALLTKAAQREYRRLSARILPATNPTVRIEDSRRRDARPDCPLWLRERGFVSSHRLALGEPLPTENTQFIGEHDDLNSELKTFRLSEVDTGVCSMKEIPQHTLEVCQLFDEEGQRLRNSTEAIELIWPKEKGEFITKDVYHDVQHFTKSDLLTKEQMSRAALQGMRSPLQQRRPPAKRQADEQ